MNGPLGLCVLYLLSSLPYGYTSTFGTTEVFTSPFVVSEDWEISLHPDTRTWPTPSPEYSTRTLSRTTSMQEPTPPWGNPFIRPKIGDSEQPAFTAPDGHVTVFEELQFECVLPDADPDWLYDVTWYINSQPLILQYLNVPGPDLPSSVLREQHWPPFVTLGFQVACEISPLVSATGQRLQSRFSAEFFAGIKPSVSFLSINQGETKLIDYQLTVPIACWKTQGVQQRCYLQFDASGRVPSWFCPYRTTLGTLSPDFKSFCGPIFDSANWNQPVAVEVTGVQSAVYGTRYTYVDVVGVRHLPVSGSYRDVWEGVKANRVTLRVSSSSNSAGGTCYANNDPHMRTFDGRSYENQIEGTYILYKHTELPYAVHLLQRRCYGSRTTPVCNFGVAIQSGPDIFVLTRDPDSSYGDPLRLKTYGCFKSGIKVIRGSSYTAYKVVLPSGATVEISRDISSVRVHASPADVGKAEGLCGNADGDQCNDFLFRDGVTTSSACPFTGSYSTFGLQPTDFILSWRVQPGENLYYGEITGSTDIGSVPDVPVTGNFSHCTCKSPTGQQGFQWAGLPTPEFSCVGHPPSAECNLQSQDADVTNLYQTCSVKRAANILDLEEDDLPQVTFDPDTNPPDPHFTNGWTEAAARTHCTQLITGHAVYQSCQSISQVDLNFSITMCIQDIQLSGDTSWADLAVESYKQQCEDAVLTDNTLWEEPASGQSVLVSVIEVVCPGDCNGHGQCVDGLCDCDADHAGPDCSVEVGIPPGNLTIPKSGLCDVSTKPCQATRVYGGMFLQSANLTCRMTEFQVDGVTKHVTGYSETTTSIFVNENEVICILPETASHARTGAVAPFLTGYTVTVSNDGVAFGDGAIILPRDPACFNCTVTSDQAVCVQKTNACYVGKVCYAPGARHPSKACYECDPAQATLSWSFNDVGQACGAGDVLAEKLLTVAMLMTSALIIVTSSM